MEDTLPTSTDSLASLVDQIRDLLRPHSSTLTTTKRGLSHLPASLPHQLQQLMRQYVSHEPDFLPYAYFPTPTASPLRSDDKPLPSSSPDSTDTEGSPPTASSHLGRHLAAATCAPKMQKKPSNNGTYTRNLVDRGNGEYNLLVLCWPPGASSSIHDHPGAHCIVKMLSGRLREKRYRRPDPARGETGPGLIKTSDRVLHRDGVTYMHDKFGLHSMHNDFSHDHHHDELLLDDDARDGAMLEADDDERAISLHLYSPPIPLCSAFDPSNGCARVVDCQRMESVNGVRSFTTD